MKPTSLSQLLSDHLWQLHCMEMHISRTLPALAASVLNPRLRRLLSERAMCAYERREILEELLRRHAHPLATKTRDLIKGILVEGNRDLARIHNPCSLDVAMIEHCIRIEQHATTAYGIAVPLTSRMGFPQVGDKLKLLLTDLVTARSSFHALEMEVFSIAARHHPPAA